MSFLLKIGKKCSDITLGKILLTRYAKNYQTFPRMWTKDEEVVSNCKAYAHIRSNQILMIPECATCVTNMYSSMYPDTYRNVSCTTPYITRWLMIWPSFAVNVSICKGLMHFGFLAKKRCHYHLLPFFYKTCWISDWRSPTHCLLYQLWFRPSVGIFFVRLMKNTN